MAARKRLRLAAKTRERTQTSMLVNRLLDHVFGKCEMTPSQVKAALVAVLRKTLPDLKAVKAEYDTAPSCIDAMRANYRDDDKSQKPDAKKSEIDPPGDFMVTCRRT